jgi:hypothetical protein
MVNGDNYGTFKYVPSTLVLPVAYFHYEWETIRRSCGIQIADESPWQQAHTRADVWESALNPLTYSHKRASHTATGIRAGSKESCDPFTGKAGRPASLPCPWRPNLGANDTRPSPRLIYNRFQGASHMCGFWRHLG